MNGRLRSTRTWVRLIQRGLLDSTPIQFGLPPIVVSKHNAARKQRFLARHRKTA